MFNVTVLRIKDLKKYLILVISILLILYVCKSTSGKLEETSKLNSPIDIINKDMLTGILKKEFVLIESIGENKIYEEEKDVSEDFDFNIANSFALMEMVQKNEIKKEEQFVEDLDINGEMKIKEGENPKIQKVQTQITTKKPLKDGYNVTYGNVRIKNESGYELTKEILEPNIKIENKNIFVFHTHTCESYTSSEKYKYNQTGNYRTTDLAQSVARVGKEFKDNMSKFRMNVFHNQDYHDYPAYNGSYTRSLNTIQKELLNNPCDIVIDIHRDAIGSISDYAPTVKIGEEEAAQIMFVIGTNAGGLEHPNWQQNLKFAVKVQEKAEEMYPGLFKTMLVTYSRYNQHTAKYASILEVGATGNTLDQTIVSMKYLANVMSETLK